MTAPAQSDLFVLKLEKHNLSTLKLYIRISRHMTYNDNFPQLLRSIDLNRSLSLLVTTQSRLFCLVKYMSLSLKKDAVHSLYILNHVLT